MAIKKRKIELVTKKVSFAESEEMDINYWADKSIKDRVSEASKWISDVWKFHEQIHGKWQSIAEGKHLKSQTDEDDF